MTAKYIAEFVYQQGVRTVYMLSGTGSIYLDDAFAFHDGLKYICARHEAAAVMMAEANAKITQNLGIVIATTGPGGTNAIGGLVEAWVDSVPVLVISGQVANEHIVEDVRSYGVQGFNIIKNVKNMTKYAEMVKDPTSIRYHMEKAIYLAKSGRPGPVWLDIPLDVQKAEIDIEELQGYEPETLQDVNQGIEGDVENIVNSLMLAKRPLIVIGQGIRNAMVIPEFKEFVKSVNAPVIASRLGLDILPYSYKNYFGLGGMRGRKHTALIMKQCDLILSLGSSLAFPFIGERSKTLSKDVKIIMVNTDKAELNKPGLKVEFPILKDVREVIVQLIKKIRDVKMPDYSAWMETCSGYKEKYSTVVSEYKKNPINSYYFLERLEEHSKEKTIFVSDAGSSYYITGQTLKFNKGQRDITSGAFASMGLAIPLSIGCGSVNSNVDVLVVTGDGSIELNIQELRTISQNNLNIKVFVINNGGYASIRNSQDNICGGRYTDDAEILDFSKVAEAFELPFCLIENYEEIDEKIRRVLSKKGPALVEVVCDRDQKILKNFE